MSKNINVAINYQLVNFDNRTGQRGRPQKNPHMGIDMSGAESLVAEYGEKQVRLAAFRQLRASLGLDANIVISQHPKNEELWIVKTEALKQNIYLTVLPGAVEAVAETVAEAAPVAE
jgi:hypothetical protein